MTTHGVRVFPNHYRDSIALLGIAAELSRLAGVDAATVVMATPANIDAALAAGVLGADALRDGQTSPNDILVAVRGARQGCDAALERAEQLLTGPGAVPGGEQRNDAAAPPQPAAFSAAVHRMPGGNLALISVPGDYAAAEAHKALRLGLHVMIFSDNVSVHDEVRLKTLGAEAGLLVMGPDCGTAIISGVPLGFANAVRRGPIGVIGASGTGTQEVTCRIHRAGSGISHALGVGGRDLSDAVGARATLQALAALAADDTTEVVVVVSKPPGKAVVGPLCDALAACGKPVVAVFLGVAAEEVARPGVHPAATLAEAADIAVGLARPTADRQPDGGAGPAGGARTGQRRGRRAGALPQLRPPPIPLVPRRGMLRGAFAGGTFCYEAAIIARRAGVPADRCEFIDFGDDAYTVGRPHPMIDPALRDGHVAAALADPETAVVVVDVVLGHGATDSPATGLCEQVRAGLADRARLYAHVGAPVMVGHVCGTGDDPQDRAATIDMLAAAGVLVASSNAEAASWAAAALMGRLGP